jgi:hypothetical protein
MRKYTRIKLEHTVPNVRGEDKGYFEPGDTNGCEDIFREGDDYFIDFRRSDGEPYRREVHASNVIWSEPAPVVKRVVKTATTESGQA